MATNNTTTNATGPIAGGRPNSSIGGIGSMPNSGGRAAKRRNGRSSVPGWRSPRRGGRPAGQTPGGTGGVAAPRASSIGRRKRGRASHSVRPSSSLIVDVGTPSARRRMKFSDAAMRWPWTSSSASGRRRRCDQTSSAAACSPAGASAPGNERRSNSARASRRSADADSTRTRSCSTCCCHIQPETSANSANAATTVSQMRR